MDGFFRYGLFIAIAGIVMAFASRILALGDGGGSALTTLLGLGGTTITLIGSMIYAMSKGRSVWWGLLGLFSVLGLIVLICLGNHSPLSDRKATVMPRRTTRPRS